MASPVIDSLLNSADDHDNIARFQGKYFLNICNIITKLLKNDILINFDTNLVKIPHFSSHYSMNDISYLHSFGDPREGKAMVYITQVLWNNAGK